MNFFPKQHFNQTLKDDSMTAIHCHFNKLHVNQASIGAVSVLKCYYRNSTGLKYTVYSRHAINKSITI